MEEKTRLQQKHNMSNSSLCERLQRQRVRERCVFHVLHHAISSPFYSKPHVPCRVFYFSQVSQLISISCQLTISRALVWAIYYLFPELLTISAYLSLQANIVFLCVCACPCLSTPLHCAFVCVQNESRKPAIKKRTGTFRLRGTDPAYTLASQRRRNWSERKSE